MKAVVALGSNQGDRVNFLKNALLELKKDSKIRVTKVSKIYQTKAVGGVTENPFLNAVLELETDLTPNQVLDLLKEVEIKNFRIREQKWGDRTLDLDLITCDDLVFENEDLTIPHPLAHTRGFVLVPWAEINPGAYIPNHGKIEDLLKNMDVSDIVMYQEF
jgi:2-amino-4-hydroxy-6-hydroxymethyldihydropteridine diphosphokinase